MNKETARRIRDMIEILHSLQDKSDRERQIAVTLAFIDGYIARTLEEERNKNL